MIAKVGSNNKNNNNNNLIINNNTDNNAQQKEKDDTIKDVSFWCWMVLSMIKNGQFSAIPRAASVMCHLSPHPYNPFQSAPPISTSITPSNSSSSSYESLDLPDTKKEVVELVLIENMLDTEIVQECYKYLQFQRLTFTTLLDALRKNNIMSLLSKNSPEREDQSEPFLDEDKIRQIESFLLVLVYLKLIQSDKESQDEILQALEDISQYSPLATVIMHRKLRFYDRYTSENQLESRSLFFNELFEEAYLKRIAAMKGYKDVIDVIGVVNSTPETTTEHSDVHPNDVPPATPSTSIGGEFANVRNAGMLANANANLMEVDKNTTNNNSNNNNNNNNYSNNNRIEKLGRKNSSNKSVPSVVDYMRDDQSMENLFYFDRVRQYLGKSDKMVLLNLRFLVKQRISLVSNHQVWTAENVSLLIEVLKQKTTSANENILASAVSRGIIDSVIRLIGSWMNVIPTRPRNRERTNGTVISWWEADRPRMTEMITQVVQSVCNILFCIPELNMNPFCSMGIFYLGFAVGILRDSTKLAFTTLTNILRSQGPMILSHPRLYTIFMGIAFAISGAAENQLSSIITIILTMWDRGYGDSVDLDNTGKSLILFPSIEHGMMVYKVIRLVLLTRSNYSEKLRQLQTIRIKNNNTQQYPMHEEKWMDIMSNCFYDLFMKGSYTCRIICTFAATGFLKGLYIIEKGVPSYFNSIINIEEYRQRLLKLACKSMEIIFDHKAMVESLPPNIAHPKKAIWELEVCIVASFTHSGINPSHNTHAYNAKAMLAIMKVLLRDSVGNDVLRELLRLPLPSSSRQRELQQLLEKHRRSSLVYSVGPMTRMAAELFVSLPNENNARHDCIKQIHEFGEWVYVDYRNVGKHVSGSTTDRATLQSVLQPLFVQAYLSFTFFFSMVGNSLSASQSVIALDTLSFWEFSSIERLQVASQTVALLVQNIEKDSNECIKVLENIPSLELVNSNNSSSKEKMDRVLHYRIIFYLGVVESLLNRFHEVNLANILIPKLFQHIQTSNMKLSSRAHQVFKRIFSLSETQIRTQIVPHYLKISLEGMGTTTQPESLAEAYSAIFTHFSPTDPILLYAVRSLSQVVTRRLSNTSNALSETQKYLIVLLFQLIAIVDVKILDLVLEEIELVVLTAPSKIIQAAMLRLLFAIVAQNYDYTRKNMCIKWYLLLRDQLDID